MKRSYTVISLMAVISITVLSACGALGQPPPTAAATQSPATEAPTSTQPPSTAPSETPTTLVEAPIDLAGPPMEVGSFYTYVDGSILAAVPGGPFKMGYNNYFDSKEHEVTLSDYWIYTSEVTNQQFALCVDAGKCAPPVSKDNPSYGNYRLVSYPVTGVNYQQASDYCTFVHGRLPTEAEWEKAGRGPDGNLFPWGDKAPICDLLNFNFCKGKAIDVKSYPDGVSFYGLFDMSGNVTEWVADWYAPEYALDAASSTDPLGPALGEKRSVRSSSYQDSGGPAVLAHRYSLKPESHLPDLGFRCVVEDPTYYGLYCQGLTLYGSDINGNPTDDVIPVPDSCKQSTISGVTDCKKTTDTYVTVNVEPGASLTIPPSPQCQGGPPTYECNGSGTASISPQVCIVPVPPSGGNCSPGYVKQADPGDPSKSICVGKGPGKECLPGFDYDPALQCCSAVNPGPNQYGLCGPGFYQQGNVCIPSGSNPPPLVTVSLSWIPIQMCNGGSTTPCDPNDKVNFPNGCGNTGGCTNGPPANGCPVSTRTGKPGTWNPNTCQCEN